MRRSQRRRPANVEVPPPPESSFSFSFTLTRVAMSQICQSVGFKGAQNSALQVVTDIATIYLKSIAKLAAASANSYGRTESNLSDIIVALEDLAAVQGFAGASVLRSRSLYSSAVIKDLMKFVNYTDEIPFAQPLPFGKISNFLKCRGSCVNNNKLCCDGKKLNHVPRWLPPLPSLEATGTVEKDREVRWGCLDEGVKREEENKLGVVVEIERNGEEIKIFGERESVRFKIGEWCRDCEGRWVG